MAWRAAFARKTTIAVAAAPTIVRIKIGARIENVPLRNSMHTVTTVNRHAEKDCCLKSSHIHSRRFAILGKRSSIKKECTIAGYKSDLYIEDTKTVVEIKSILSFRGEAEFPSVYSQRAVDQLMKIEDLLEKGYRACYVFVSLNPKVKQLTLNNELMFLFSRTLPPPAPKS